MKSSILIVEDEAGIAQFLAQGLEEEGYRIAWEEQGEAGLALHKEQPFDLILLDWMLPGISGLEFCQQLRRWDATTPIIFLTARDTVEDTVKGLRAGAQDYIKKPFHFSELLERIRIRLQPIGQRQENWDFGPIKIEVSRRKVFYHQEEVALTQREFDLLHYLVKNSPQVCTRSAILSDVWDIHFDYESGVIDVYINALRQKLSLRGSQNYIRTIRGVGYQWEVL